MWSKKQRRAFQRASSGVRVAKILKQPIKHLVLTTSPEAKDRNLSSDLQVLRKSIFRKFGVLLPYFKVRTNEGYGVLHVLYRSEKYLPQQWLSKEWSRIHLSSYVYVKEAPDDAARYIVAQYVSSQDSSYQRCSWSHNWVCKGFVKAWHDIVRSCRDYSKGHKNEYGLWCYPVDFNLAISKWDKWLIWKFFYSKYFRGFVPTTQLLLDNF